MATVTTGPQPPASVIPPPPRKSLWRAKPQPWMPPDWDEDVLWAVRQLSQGKANTGQQQLAWDWLMYLTGASESFSDLSFRPGEDGRRATDFAEGKRFVGLQVRKMLATALTPTPEPYAEPEAKPPRRRRAAPKQPTTRKRR